jgi:hypothetical protein
MELIGAPAKEFLQDVKPALMEVCMEEVNMVEYTCTGLQHIYAMQFLVARMRGCIMTL